MRHRRLRFAAISFVIVSATLVVVLMVNIAASRVGGRLDVTATGEHRLAPRTRQILDRLDGPHEIVIAADLATLDRQSRREVGDVLDGLTNASDRLTVTRIDTGRADGLDNLTDLLVRLRERESVKADAQTETVGQAVGLTEELAAYLRETLSPALLRAREAIPEDSIGAETNRAFFEQRAAAARTLASGFDQVVEVCRGELDDPPGVLPIPRLDRIAQTLIPPLEECERQFAFLAEQLDAFARAEELPGEPRDLSVPIIGSVSARRDRVAVVLDRLRAMEKLDLLRVAGVLESNEAVLVIGDGGVSGIALDVLFPSGIEDSSPAGGRANLRRRGEELLATAIGSISGDAQPVVIIVHGELEPFVDTTPVFAMLKERLGRRGIDVFEWASATQPEPPDLEANGIDVRRPVVFAALAPEGTSGGPTPEQSGMQRARRFGEAVAALIDSGEPVLVSVNPSVLPSSGNDDPASSFLLGFGVRASSGTPILMEQTTSDGRTIVTDLVALPEGGEHPIAGALRGLRTLMVWPIPLESVEVDGVRTSTLLELNGEGTWAESQWLNLRQMPRAQRSFRRDLPEFDEGIDTRAEEWTVALACERDLEDERTQRLVVVGSNGWFFDQLSQQRGMVDGRVTLLYPGNMELLEASVQWLAGREDLIAQSPESRAVSLIRPMSEDELTLVRWGVIGGLPLLVLVLGVGWRIVFR